MQRLALILSAYSYHIEYQRSILHANCGALSRLPLKQDSREERECYNVYFLDELLVTREQVALATRRSPVLSKVVDSVLSGWASQCDDPELKPFFNRKNELSVDRGILLWGMRVVIPELLRDCIPRELHNQHLGICKMKA